MKPLILFTAMTVIGIIGIIGTVEYAQAQTILPIPPTNIPTAGQPASIQIQSTSIANTWIDIENRTIPNLATPTIGSIWGPRDVLIQSNPIFSTAISGETCWLDLRSVKTILDTPSNYNIPNLAVPDNITPNTNSTIHAIGIDFHGSGEDRTMNCTPNLEATNTTPILTTKELRYTITDKHDKAPYYFSPRENITQAQPIPICTTTNFDTTAQTLKGKQEMCYGKNGNDMIIITKRLTGFYGAADTVNTPTKTVDFTGTPKTTQPANNNNDDSSNDDSDEYIALLKRLYLPPI